MTDVAPLLVLGDKGCPARETRIAKAAVRVGDQVYTDWRHSFIIQHLSRLDIQCAQEDQGFIDECGVFYGRYQAARIALYAKQIARLTPMLTSEDLWDDDGTPREPSKPYDPMGDHRRALDEATRRQSAVDRAAEWRDRNRR